jgi:malonyl-CoA O-methyltransferase
MVPTPRNAGRSLDAVALARVAQRLQRAAVAPWLHREVARRMAERLPLIRRRPESVLDWGAFIGASRECLQRAYPQARLIAVEPDSARRHATASALRRPWWAPRSWGRAAPEVIEEVEVAEARAQLVWANMALLGVVDPQPMMARWHRALEVDGFLMFSTLGPGSLRALGELYAGQGWPPAYAPFIDMHDLGDMLLAAGFADPVMDQEQITLSWDSAPALLAELRLLGGNVHPQRLPGLRTPRWRERLLQLLEAGADASGRPALGFEIIYGHAFRAAPRVPASAQTRVPLSDLRETLRTRPRSPGAT